VSKPAQGPVRVMHVIFSLRMGGTEHALVKLVNALDPASIASEICSCQPADTLKTRLDRRVLLHEFNRRKGNDPAIVLHLARLFRQRKPDIVHTHSWGTLCEGVLAARLARVPYIVHGEHGTMETRPRNLRIQRFVWQRTDRVLAVCGALADNMTRQTGYARDRISVLLNGVDVNRFAPGRREAARAKLSLAPDEFVIGTVGRLVPVKDHDTLLHALAMLKRKNIRFKAVIAGDGPLREALAATAARLGVARSVDWLGSRDDVEDVLSALDVFVLSSASEGLSNTLLESMATGLPAVATRVGAADELIDHGRTGLLVAPGSAKPLAEALATVYASPDLRREMAARARRKAQQQFSLDRMAAAYEQLYLEVAHAQPRGRRVDTEAICAG
jgi:sugar transferase (PEP-CTERM/EpsH1 system associated)